MPRAPDLAGHALEGRYELHEMLGEGSFGRVYRGLDRRLGRAIAVKVIKPWWAEDSAWVERFQREAELLARVSDPGIVQIFDVGHAEEGPYYVTELVEGESLADRLRRGPLPVEEARTTAEQLCRALASAHAEGVVHCDVKPPNVLLSTGGTVKVGDFGVARLADSASQGVSATVAGTPRYMSPEQARGRATTAATDVYSAGVVLYEMLAGRPPFLDGSPVELGLHHLQDPPPALPRTVPPQLREVVGRALAKDPADRYPDGGAMAKALYAARPPGGNPLTDLETSLRNERALAGTTTAAVISEPQTVNLAEATRHDLARARTRVLPGPHATPAARSPARPTRAHGRRRLIKALIAVVLLAGGATAALLLLGQASRTTVPELLKLPRGGVEARARRLHVVPAFSGRHSDAPAGIAIAQDPTAGTRLADGSTVRVVLSTGPPPVVVPGVVGSSAVSAENRLANAGLRYGVTVVAAPGSTPGVVISQSPSPPATAPSRSTVALSISETPRWRALTTFSGVDDGRSTAFRIRGSRWRVTYTMAFRGTCLLLVVCGGPSAEARDLNTGSAFGGFELGEGESRTHLFSSGPGLYRLVISGGRDSAHWSMTVQDYY
jgi:serine/threonine-protein kinase